MDHGKRLPRMIVCVATIGVALTGCFPDAPSPPPGVIGGPAEPAGGSPEIAGVQPHENPGGPPNVRDVEEELVEPPRESPGVETEEGPVEIPGVEADNDYAPTDPDEVLVIPDEAPGDNAGPADPDGVSEPVEQDS
jgi:hypothetical protein